MLDSVTAVRFEHAMSSGRTGPCIMTCTRKDGAEVELVVKLAAGCDMGTRSLMTEAIVSILAADLGLPIPEPFLVFIEAEFAGTIPIGPAQGRAIRSLGWNFGSRKLPPGLSTYPSGQPLPVGLLPLAAEIFAFDNFILNPDRTVANPNLLYDGRALFIYDHELALIKDGIVGWKPPWQQGGIPSFKGLPPRGRHVFFDQLCGRPFDLSRLAEAFKVITPSRLTEYVRALPAEWVGDSVVANEMLAYLADLTAHIDEAIDQVVGALK